MFSKQSSQLRPRIARHFSQVLAEPMAFNQAPVLVSKLSNGVRIATKESFNNVASVGFFLNAGVRAETKHNVGAAHVIEQLVSTGTELKSQDQFSKELESLGAVMDVHTGRETTAYQLSLGHGDLAQGIDILADVVHRPALTNIYSKRDEIIRNLEDKDQTARDVIDDRLHQCAFRDCTLGFSRVGPFSNIEDLTPGHLQAYIDSNYTADNLVVVATGQVNHADVVEMASKSVGSWFPSQMKAFGERPYFCGADLIYRNDEMGPTAYVSVGWEGVPHKSSDAVTLMLMASVIGKYDKDGGLVPGNISGNRTINAVANKMQVGCANQFEAFSVNYKDTGVWGFYAACDEVAVEHCVGELQFGTNLLAFSVTDEEVERAKRELKVELFGGAGSSSEICTEVGNQVLAYGRAVPPAEMILRIDAIDAEEVKRVAFKYLNDKEIAVTGLGPLHGLNAYLEMRRATVMHRY